MRTIRYALPLISVCTLLPAQEVRWHDGDLQSARSSAARSNQDLLLYFWSETSNACSAFYQGPLRDPRAVDASQPFVCYSAQLETGEGRELFGRFGIQTMPSILLVDPGDLSAQNGIIGSVNVPTLVRNLEEFAQNQGTLRDLTDRCAKEPDDLELRGKLADRYASLGDVDKAKELRASIRAADPDGTSAVAARMYLNEHIGEILNPAAELKAPMVRRLIAYLADMTPPPALRAGWEQVASMQSGLGDWKGEFTAWRNAYPHVPDGGMLNWGWNRALWWWSNWDILSKDQKEFAVEVARKTAAVSERLSAEDPAYYDPGIFLTRRLHSLAMVLYRAGEQSEAVQLMERCVELSPDDGEYQQRMAAYRAGDADGYFQGYSDFDASWSPDSRRVVFTSTRDRNGELYVADVAKGKLKRITRSLFEEDHATFAKKGKELLFRSDRFKTFGIYRSKASGKGVELQIPIQGSDGFPVGSGLPQLSPDGKSIALLRMDAGVVRAMVGSPHGHDLKALGGASQGEDSLCWAGKKIAFTSTRGNQKNLFLANPDGSGEQQLTPSGDGAWETDVSASKDGSRLVFASWVDGQCDIWSIDASGENLTRLTDSESQDRRPRLAPNGRKIVFDRTGPDGNSRLWIMNADGSGAKPLLGA